MNLSILTTHPKIPEQSRQQQSYVQETENEPTKQSNSSQKDVLEDDEAVRDEEDVKLWPKHQEKKAVTPMFEGGEF